MVEVSPIQPHAGARQAVDAIGYAGFKADLLEGFSPAVGPEEVWHGVIGDEEIGISIVIEIGCDYAPGLARLGGNSRALADVLKLSIAEMVIKVAGHGSEDFGIAVAGASRLRSTVLSHPAVGFSLATDPLIGVVGKFTDKQVQLAIVVVIEPKRAASPLRGLDAARRGHIGKGTVSVVVIENRLADAGDEDVQIPVMVIVGDSDAHAKKGGIDPGLLRYVAEGAVMIVAVKSKWEGGLRVEKGGGTGVDQENVHPAVIVVIENGHAGPHRFRKIMLRRAA